MSATATIDIKALTQEIKSDYQEVRTLNNDFITLITYEVGRGKLSQGWETHRAKATAYRNKKVPANVASIGFYSTLQSYESTLNILQAKLARLVQEYTKQMSSKNNSPAMTPASPADHSSPNALVLSSLDDLDNQDDSEKPSFSENNPNPNVPLTPDNETGYYMIKKPDLPAPISSEEWVVCGEDD